MNRKNFTDMIICSISAAVIILCVTYMGQERTGKILASVCGMVFIAFLLAAAADTAAGRKKGMPGKQAIQTLVLLDEEGNEINAWHIGGKTSVLIGRDRHRKNVDVNLQDTEYGGMADRQHAVLNYAGGQWYVEDLGSRNGVKIQAAGDKKIYQVSGEHMCRLNAGDIILIGNTRLGIR